MIKILNEKIAKVTALLVSGVLQSGKLPVDAEQVAGYYMKLYDLLAEKMYPSVNQRQSDNPRSIARITEEPDEIW